MACSTQGFQRSRVGHEDAQRDRRPLDYADADGCLDGAIQLTSALHKPRSGPADSRNDRRERFSSQLQASANHAAVAGPRGVPRGPAGSQVRRLLLPCRCKPPDQQLIKN